MTNLPTKNFLYLFDTHTILMRYSNNTNRDRPREKESVFRANVQTLRRVVIPKEISEALGIKQGDKVEIVIRKV